MPFGVRVLAQPMERCSLALLTLSRYCVFVAVAVSVTEVPGFTEVF